MGRRHAVRARRQLAAPAGPAVPGHQQFSQGGDSGSLIVSHPRLDAAALLFAGNDEGVTYGNPIAAVLDALGATLLT